MLAGGPLQTGQSPVCHRFAKQNGVSAPSGADQGPAPPPHRFNPRTKKRAIRLVSACRKSIFRGAVRLPRKLQDALFFTPKAYDGTPRG